MNPNREFGEIADASANCVVGGGGTCGVMRSEILDCLSALATLTSAAGFAASGLAFLRDAAVAAEVRGFRGGGSFLSGWGSLFLRGFFSLGGGWS